MSASSYLGPGFQPWLARLLNPDGAWCSGKNDGSQYLQIHFSQVREIRQLRTQGSVSQKAWVKTYFIQHSQDGETWTNYTKSRQTVVRLVWKNKCVPPQFGCGFYDLLFIWRSDGSIESCLYDLWRWKQQLKNVQPQPCLSLKLSNSTFRKLSAVLKGDVMKIKIKRQLIVGFKRLMWESLD